MTTFKIGPRPRKKQFSLGTLLLFFLVFWTALAAFGVWGILVLAIYFSLMWLTIDSAVPRKLVIWAVVIFAGFVMVDFVRMVAISMNDYKPAYECSRFHLDNIGRALQHYHDANGCFPPVYATNEKGKPVHSWRAFLLEGPDWSGKYDFSEPWNGKNNRMLLAQGCSYLYQCPADVSRRRTANTSYVAVVGPNTAWQTNKGVSLKDITDQPEETVLLVEVYDSHIPWTKPRDISLQQALDGPDGKAAVPTSGHAYPGLYFFHGMKMAGSMLMADGSVVHLKVRPSAKDMAALLSINGNEKVDIRALEAAQPPGGPYHWEHIVGLPLFLIAITFFWIRILPKRKVYARKKK